MSSFSQFFGGGGGGFDMATHAATGFAKPSIVLFDTRAGTRNFVVPEGVTRIRAAVVGAGGNGTFNANRPGAGGGYSEREYLVNGGDTISYTVGAVPSGTSSFAGPTQTITATGGGNGGSSGFAIGGSGSGGDVNTNGGNSASQGAGGSSSGNRHGNGVTSTGGGGAGWGPNTATRAGGGSNGVDGFGLGLVGGHVAPFSGSNNGLETNNHSTNMSGYGCGGSGSNGGANGGMGGGGGSDDNDAENSGNGGIGGGGSRGGGAGGFGLVLVEVLETE